MTFCELQTLREKLFMSLILLKQGGCQRKLKRNFQKSMRQRAKEILGTYHLHGKPGNSGWKMKWYVPFHLKHFRNHIGYQLNRSIFSFPFELSN